MPNVSKPKPDTHFEQLIDRSDVVGRGTARVVYGVIGFPDVVIKEQSHNHVGSNHIEWIVWTALEEMGDEQKMGNEPNPELKDLFAKCFEISTSSRYLMMERFAPIMIPLQAYPAVSKTTRS